MALGWSRPLLGILFLGLPLSAPLAASFEEGLAAAGAGDMQGALAIWRPLAEQGDARSQYHLGLAFERGAGAALEGEPQVVLGTGIALLGERTPDRECALHVTGSGRREALFERSGQRRGQGKAEEQNAKQRTRPTEGHGAQSPISRIETIHRPPRATSLARRRAPTRCRAQRRTVAGPAFATL